MTSTKAMVEMCSRISSLDGYRLEITCSKVSLLQVLCYWDLGIQSLTV